MFDADVLRVIQGCFRASDAEILSLGLGFIIRSTRSRPSKDTVDKINNN